MIREIADPVERERVFERARVFVGSDEQYLAPEWLARSDVYCVAQENAYNGYHDDPESLVRAFGVLPGTRWCAVRAAGREKLSEPVEATDLVYRLTAAAGTDNFESYYYPSGFMLFSLDSDAVILYSPDYGYRLIAGSAQFVQAYIDGAKLDPIQELREWFQEKIDDRRQEGNEQAAIAIERTMNTGLAQVRLPPPANELT